MVCNCFQLSCDRLRLVGTVCDRFRPFTTLLPSPLSPPLYLVHLNISLSTLSVTLTSLVITFILMMKCSCLYQRPHVGSMLGHCLRFWPGGQVSQKRSAHSTPITPCWQQQSAIVNGCYPFCQWMGYQLTCTSLHRHWPTWLNYKIPNKSRYIVRITEKATPTNFNT